VQEAHRGSKPGDSMLHPTLRFVVIAWTLCFASNIHAQDLSGCWQGQWKDCRSGHSGPLKGKITQCGDDQYDVVFTGRFLRVVPFRFRTTLDVVESDGTTVRLAGTSRVGIFGTFTYSAEATDHDFNASFRSRRYDGQFNLTR
jgi:hypothetical protein